LTNNSFSLFLFFVFVLFFFFMSLKALGIKDHGMILVSLLLA
jgi:hypothetical protein